MALCKKNAFCVDQKSLMAAIEPHSFSIGPYVKMKKKNSKDTILNIYIEIYLIKTEYKNIIGLFCFGRHHMTLLSYWNMNKKPFCLSKITNWFEPR